MNLIDALPKDIFGEITNSRRAKDGEGNIYPGIVDPLWLADVFADYIDLPVPLTEAQFMALVGFLGSNWPDKCKIFRNQGEI